jgi:HlyD family secretion protein
VERLAETGAVPFDEQDRARQRAEADRAAADAADARRRASVGGARSEDRAVARAALDSAEGRLAQAEAALDQLLVRAPERGEILQVKVRVGEYYLPGGEPLVVLGDTSELLARVDVDERDVAGLALGAKAKVRVPAWPDRVFEGTVTEIGRRMGRKNVRTDDPVERNDVKILEVLVTIEDPEALRVGQRVVASIDRGAGPPNGGELVAEAPAATVPPG